MHLKQNLSLSFNNGDLDKVLDVEPNRGQGIDLEDPSLFEVMIILHWVTLEKIATAISNAVLSYYFFSPDPNNEFI